MIFWEMVSKSEAKRAIDPLLSSTLAALKRCESYISVHPKDEKEQARMRRLFRTNLRRAHVRYAAVRQLVPYWSYPRIEEMLTALDAHSWCES